MAGVAAERENPTRSATLSTIIQTLGEVQLQLRHLAQEDTSGGILADTLAQAEREVAGLQRRLLAAQIAQRRRAAERETADSRGRRSGDDASDVPGLKLSTVADELASYFGEGSENGLLVLRAEPSWDPIRTGDVILTVNGAQATAERLREAADGRRPIRIELLRRKRTMTVTVEKE
jgi:hypothetical protein